ncbi:hypothetical protein ACPOL_6491 [Acidisarcina polymorpha]|uniref:Uncharacterized protein n=1 Tax=Acidisarcina polymorpha TaxID=2211140 RepID=A0A2Z5GA36_9BACT|nr:hypothetical protein ACPOL_6491 [Acidisarcina polymorpha]
MFDKIFGHPARPTTRAPEGLWFDSIMEELSMDFRKRSA